MLPFLKKFKKEHNTEDISDNEKNILITSLLIECAKGDYDFSDQEILKIKDLIKKKELIVLNKIDLLDKDVVKKTVKNFSKDKNCEVLTLSTLEKDSISKIKAKLISYVS